MLKKKRGSIDESLISGLLYAERCYFSQKNKQWSRFHIKKPRLPIPADDLTAGTRWADTKFRPVTLKAFVGKTMATVNFKLYISN